MIKFAETIIIGGGISGLSCARKLKDNEKEFLLITENIGGRIISSSDGKINYGAYFVGSDYGYVKNFVKIGRRISIFDIKFHNKKNSYFIFSCIKYLLQVIKFISILIKFRFHYNNMKKKCETMSQKEAIESDKYLFELYNKKADKFIKDNGVFDFVDKYLGEAFYALSFSKINEVYSFEFLRWMQYFIFSIYEFIFLKDRIINGFKKKIVFDSAVSIKQDKLFYNIKTLNGKNYLAKNVVVATSPNISKNLLNLKKIKKPTNCYMYHVNGNIVDNFHDVDFELFHEGYELFNLAYQNDGSYLFYSNHPNINFYKYFKKYKILAKKYWNPAFNIRGNELLDCEIKNNLYLIGDHNIGGLEDSFITGVYAANRIINL